MDEGGDITHLFLFSEGGSWNEERKCQDYLIGQSPREKKNKVRAMSPT